MKTTISLWDVLAVAAIAASALAFAQEPAKDLAATTEVSEIVLRLTAKEVEYIGAALAERPLKEVLPLWQKISAQVMEQKNPKPEPEPPNPEPTVPPPEPTEAP